MSVELANTEPASAKTSKKNKYVNRRERDQKWTPDVVRQRLQAAGIEQRLMKCFRGELKLTAQQVNIGLALLRKIVPDLQAVEVKGDIQLNVIRQEPLSSSDWASRHGETIEGEAVEVDASDCIDSASTD